VARVTQTQSEPASAPFSASVGRKGGAGRHHALRSTFSAKAIQDLWDGWHDYRELWLAIGWYDIRKRYRRSVLGPFWITISIGVLITALTFLYVPLIGRNVERYTPYVGFGFIAWQLISMLVIESCNVFVVNSPTIRQLRAPLSIYIYEVIWKNLLILAHNLLIYVVIVIIFGVWPTWATLLVIPGIFIVCLNGLWIGMLLGPLCARFRDIPPVMATIVQMMFLLTPILWRPDQVPGREFLVIFNPFYYFIELIRQPLLGNSPSPFVWSVALLITALGFVLAIPFYSRFRDRIAYWV
jgi:ABC-2 type transport system permease protein/lipopolysaccharide transport system permease protein